MTTDFLTDYDAIVGASLSSSACTFNRVFCDPTLELLDHRGDLTLREPPVDVLVAVHVPRLDREQMPADAPGTLSAQQYINVTAYTLARNGFSAGTRALTLQDAGSVKLARASAPTIPGSSPVGAPTTAPGCGVQDAISSATPTTARISRA